ncbi:MULTISPECIES: AzlD domain-containing protein [Bacillus cereus group]|uniref:AzlD domain-containing protein n=1 Tax=Bacillus cereus group TaxID=86661 RepID=UPI000BEB92E3|nr:MULTISPECIES: AzlD domain-containing protein [Bacillus cereus group]PDY54786.1 branched-chain amino acid ABC transporter [Bacillus toyonensis]PFV86983.1 branched-chain amino acid ABC transporter [Bacillus thuringiensis]
MELRWEVFLIILGSAIVTFIPRVVPLMVLSRFELPEWTMRWLNYVPISVIAALIGQEIFIHDGKIASLTNNIELCAAIPTFFIAIKTRSLLGTVLGGIISIIILRFLFQN